ncbi:MAG TPA: DUF6186 family protein [Mycobacteriales bacterium]|nr:DUF6186 family protein [Mycobacteriales bacterium]
MTRLASIVLFGLVVVCVVVLDRVARRPGSTIPTFGEVFGFLSQRLVGRAIVLGFWAWSGWHFFAR